jgi:hypothetical protein
MMFRRHRGVAICVANLSDRLRDVQPSAYSTDDPTRDCTPPNTSLTSPSTLRATPVQDICCGDQESFLDGPIHSTDATHDTSDDTGLQIEHQPLI